MQTTRFLITGVGGQGTILASDVLAEVGLRLGYDAKKPTSSGWPCAAAPMVSHIIWGDKVRAPMIDEGSRRLLHQLRMARRAAPHGLHQPGHRDPRQRLAHRSRGGQFGQAEYPAVEGIRNTMRERCAALHVLPATPMAVDMGNARVFNSIIMGKLSLLVGGDGTSGAPP